MKGLMGKILRRDRSGKLNLGAMFITFLMIIVGLGLTPTVVESVVGVTGVGGSNLTGSARAMALLISLFWVLLVLSIGVAAIVTQFRGM